MLAATARALGVAASDATLFVKPTALHAWLELCAARSLHDQPAVVRLALYREPSAVTSAAKCRQRADGIEADPYGFNTLAHHEVMLALWPANGDSVAGAAAGVLCAVLTLPSLATPTPAYTLKPRSLCTDLIVHDPRLVLVLGRVGA